MKLPRFTRQPIRPEVELEETEIWQPSWNCFCCEDTGQVTPPNAELVIPDYDYKRDRLPICQSPGCGKSSRWAGLGNNNIDMRFTPAICQQIDMHQREVWRQDIERKAINLHSLVKKRSMPGVGDRTSNDDREIQQRKTEIEAITHEQWLAMAHVYAVGKKDNDHEA